MSIFEKVDFCHYYKGPGTEFSYMGNMGHFSWRVTTTGATYPREATCKISVLLHFFPQTMIFSVQHLEY